MTPKEKAKELVDKFVILDNDIFCSVNYPYSKQCALIAIDEILKAVEEKYDWQQVKQEIINFKSKS